MSAFVHGLAMIVALGLMAQVKPEVPKDSFTWDVVLIEPQRTHEANQAEFTPTQEPATPTPHPATPAPSQPKMVMRDAQPRKVTPVAQHEIHQVVETSQPIEQTVPVQTRAEPFTPVMEQQPSEVQQTEQSVDDPVAPVVQHEAAIQPEITDAPVQPLEAHAGETTPVTHDSDAPAPPVADASDAKPIDSVAQEPTTQATTATRPTPSVKVNHGWLAESLRRRLAEIKRYPSAARLNGWEGKVVLRAVIRSDGHLSEVRVHRSSGHEALDNAAMEAIRLACPLHMHQPLGTSEVAVYVPMVYSLRS